MTMKSTIWSIVLCYPFGSQSGLAATTTHVSVNSLGKRANNTSSHGVAISANGRFD